MHEEARSHPKNGRASHRKGHLLVLSCKREPSHDRSAHARFADAQRPGRPRFKRHSASIPCNHPMMRRFPPAPRGRPAPASLTGLAGTSPRASSHPEQTAALVCTNWAGAVPATSHTGGRWSTRP